MDLDLTGRRALVGGASAGLGAGCAAALAAEGVHVGLAARPSDRLVAKAREVGGTALPTDLCTDDGPAAAVEAAVAALGGLDILVVNGGGPPAGEFSALDDRAWQQAIDLTLMSAIRLIRAALPHLQRGVNPSIAIVLSSSVRIPLTGLVTSNVLRPGLAGLIKSLAGELAPVRINGVAPGRFDTGRVAAIDQKRATAQGVTPEAIRQRAMAAIPLGRYGEASELGEVVTLMSSAVMRYVTGAIIPVDGGLVLSLP